MMIVENISWSYFVNVVFGVITLSFITVYDVVFYFLKHLSQSLQAYYCIFGDNVNNVF